MFFFTQPPKPSDFPIHEAITNCDIDRLTQLINNNPSLLEKPDLQGRTPLLYALTQYKMFDDWETCIVKELIAKNANVNACINCPDDPLHNKTALKYAEEFHLPPKIIAALTLTATCNIPKDLDKQNPAEDTTEALSDQPGIFFFTGKKIEKLPVQSGDFNWLLEW